MVLSRISDEQLLDVSAQDQSNYPPFAGQDKKGTEYWRDFPLDTAHNIRRWQRDNQNNEQTESSSQKQTSRPRTADAHATVGLLDMNNSRTPGLNIRRGISDSEAILNARQRTSLIDIQSAPRSVWHTSQTLPPELSVNGESSQPTTPALQQNGPLSGADGHPVAYHMPQEPSQWREAPSFKFQEQFLW